VIFLRDSGSKSFGIYANSCSGPNIHVLSEPRNLKGKDPDTSSGLDRRIASNDSGVYFPDEADLDYPTQPSAETAGSEMSALKSRLAPEIFWTTSRNEEDSAFQHEIPPSNLQFVESHDIIGTASSGGPGVALEAND
jgi:hypothetical protein